MSRRTARETAMHAYYQMEIHKDCGEDVAKTYIDETVSNEGDKKYINEMIHLFIKNKGTIDKNINDNLKGWSIERLSKIDLAILRISLVEMLFRDDIPVKVSINEAIELGKRYGTEESSSFISGLLGSVAKIGDMDE